MRILAINGSHRGDQGHTRFLIDLLFRGARGAGAECECVSLATVRVNRCLACGRCHTGKHPLRCVQEEQDDVRAVFEKMAQSDLLIYGTPVYVFSMSGLLKTFLDRMYGTGDVMDLRLSESGLMFHHIDAAICSKPFVTLVCCDNLEAETPKNVISYFRTYSRFMDAPQVGELVRNAGRLAGHGKDPGRLSLFPRLKRAYQAFEEGGEELATTGRIRAATQRRASQEIVPVPLFGLLKRIPSRRFKGKFVERARVMQQSLMGGSAQP
jgi:NAD(P)H-dependent FMN reductase